MIAMTINGPMRENDVGLFRRQRSDEGLVMRVIHNGLSVSLAGEHGVGVQDFRRCPGFGRSYFGTAGKFCRAAIALAPIEVEKSGMVPQSGVTRDGSGATAFGVARMAARDYYPEWPRGLLRDER